MPFSPFYLGVSLLKLNSRKKGTLIVKGLLGNLVMKRCYLPWLWLFKTERQQMGTQGKVGEMAIVA